MSENKLFALIEKLNGPEKRECTNFLRSPYFNQRADVLRLWEWLLTQRAKPEADARAAFAQIFPGETYDGARWRHLQSFLGTQIENFLAQRAFEQTPVLADLHLAPVFRGKNLHKSLDHVFRRAAGRLDHMPRDNDYHHLRYRLEWEKYAAAESQGRTRDADLTAAARALDIYLAGGKLRLACLMESRRVVFNTEYDAAFLPELLTFLEKSDLLEAPVVALYYHCYKALSGGEEAHFRAFRRELEGQTAGLPADELRIFLLLAINFCIRRLNDGALRYVREGFDLYRVGLDTGVLLENGQLSRFAYKNIVALGLKLEQFEWVEEFIGRYAPFLEEKHRAANRDYNLARLFFAQKNYRQAMPLLARVDESDLLLNLDSRVMLLKMYYETGEWDALDALIASFKIFLLRKKKGIGYHQAHYLNILRYVQKLTRLNLNDKKAVAAFRAGVTADKAVVEQEWLLKMVS